MQQQTGLVLKKGKEKPILQRHHWIYSGAVESAPALSGGSIVPVFSSEGERLGLAALNPGRSIFAHMLAFGDENLDDAFRIRIRGAFAMRKKWFNPETTNAFRLLNAEGDALPGIVVDYYDNVLVLQISNAGLENEKARIIQLLIDEIKPAAIYEKSTSFLRKKEGLKEIRSHLWGEERSRVVIRENNLLFSVDILEGQKTGFFLDQREMRALVSQIASRRRVLNMFAYTGGFTVASLFGGAERVDSIEISARCGAQINENLTLNCLPLEHHRFICEDAFPFLERDPLDYDLVILDPPAFVKKKEDIAKAFRAYKEMNRLAIQKMPSGSLLLTCSCSYHVDESLFQNILFRAALEANRSVRILGRHRMAIDHPISIFHPESSYLKSFLLYID